MAKTNTVQIKLVGDARERTVRIGNLLSGSSYAATMAPGDHGAVFVLEANERWKSLLSPPVRPGDLPENVFGPTTLPTGLPK